MVIGQHSFKHLVFLSFFIFSNPILANSDAFEHFLKSQMLFFEPGKVLDSEAELLEAIKKDPGSWYLQYALAQSYLERGAFIQAKKTLKDLLAREVVNIEILLMLGKAHIMLNEKEQAIAILERAVGLDPGHTEAKLQLALVFASQKAYPKALRILKELEQSSEEQSLVSLYQARIYLELGEEGNALAALERVMAYPNIHPEVWLLVGILKEGQGKPDDALKAYQVYSELRPKDMDVLKKLVDLHIGKNQYNTVVPLLQTLHENEPENEQITLKLALVYVELKEVEKAKAVLEALVKSNPESPVAQYYLGLVYHMMGNLGKSKDAYGKVSVGSDYFASSALQQAGILMGLQKYDEAIEILEVVEKEGKNKEDHVLLHSAAYEFKDNLPSALLVLNRFLERHPKSVAGLYAKANVEYKMEHYEKAVKTIRKLLMVDPNHVHGLNFLGFHLFTNGKEPNKALTYLKKAHSLAPDDPFVLDSMGWYYVTSKGDLEKGLVYLKKAFLFKSNDITILEHYVQTLIKLGKIEDAKKALLEIDSVHLTQKERNVVEALEIMVQSQ